MLLLAGCRGQIGDDRPPGSVEDARDEAPAVDDEDDTVLDPEGDDEPAPVVDGDDDEPTPDDQAPGPIDDPVVPDPDLLAADAPAFGGSSGGSGGESPIEGALQAVGDIQYWLIVPPSYDGSPTPLLVYYAGSAGAEFITLQFLWNAGPQTGTDGFLEVALDPGYDAAAGATVIDAVRAAYNVDNDRTTLISQSAGTGGGLDLAFHLRQAWFAAVFANDVTVVDAPELDAAELGFVPWGNAAPGGNFEGADWIVTGMRDAGYALGDPAPYDGPGSDVHGSLEQQLIALESMVGKSRR